MSALIRARSRILDTISISRRCIRQFSSSGVGTEPFAEPVMEASKPLEKKSRNHLKLGLFFVGGAIFATGVASATYATVVYSFDDFEDKTKHLRSLTKYSAGEDTPLREKVQGSLVASAMRVAAKCAETYLSVRRLYDDRVIVLPDEQIEHEFTLILDLNETLVFSGWTGGSRGWMTVKRPGVGDFLHQLSQFYEIVVFSDQLKTYVDPVVEKMDLERHIKYKLSRFDMTFRNGKRYKDFKRLNRDPAKIIYVTSAAFDRSNLHPENTVQIQTWKGTPEDTTLVDLIPFLTHVAKSKPDDVRLLIASYKDGGRQ